MSHQTQQEPQELIVHSGPYHTDDVLVAVILKNIYPGIKITRTRDPQTLEAALKDPSIIVADTGGFYDHALHNYDHHQDDSPARSLKIRGVQEEIPYSASGLIWKHFGHTYLQNKYGELSLQKIKMVWQILEHQFFAWHDVWDDGKPEHMRKELEGKTNSFGKPFFDQVRSFIPTWEETRELSEKLPRFYQDPDVERRPDIEAQKQEDRAFLKAVSLMEKRNGIFELICEAAIEAVDSFIEEKHALQNRLKDLFQKIKQGKISESNVGLLLKSSLDSEKKMVSAFVDQSLLQEIRTQAQDGQIIGMNILPQGNGELLREMVKGICRGSVYFDVSKVSINGELSRKSVDEFKDHIERDAIQLDLSEALEQLDEMTHERQKVVRKSKLQAQEGEDLSPYIETQGLRKLVPRASELAKQKEWKKVFQGIDDKILERIIVSQCYDLPIHQLIDPPGSADFFIGQNKDGTFAVVPLNSKDGVVFPEEWRGKSTEDLQQIFKQEGIENIGDRAFVHKKSVTSGFNTFRQALQVAVLAVQKKVRNSSVEQVDSKLTLRRRTSFNLSEFDNTETQSTSVPFM